MPLPAQPLSVCHAMHGFPPPQHGAFVRAENGFLHNGFDHTFAELQLPAIEARIWLVRCRREKETQLLGRFDPAVQSKPSPVGQPCPALHLLGSMTDLVDLACRSPRHRCSSGTLSQFSSISLRWARMLIFYATISRWATESETSL